MRHIVTALSTPHRFFSELGESGQVPWLLGGVGYLLAGLADPSEGLTSMLVSFLDALAFAVLGCYVGSKALGGRAGFWQLLGAVGVAYIWPSLAAIPSSYAILHYLADHPFKWPVYLTIHVLFVIWFLDLAYEAVRSVNGFGVFRGLVVIVWGMLVGIPMFVALAMFVPAL